MDSLSMKDLAKILNITAPIYYNTGLFGDSMIKFLAESVDGNITGIYIDDLEVKQFVNKYIYFNNYDMIGIEELLRKEFQIQNNIPSVFIASFMLFHEEGHWMDLTELFTGNYDSFIKTYKINKILSNFSRFHELAEKEKDDKLKHFYYVKASRSYRELPLEKSADDYAIRKINDNNDIIDNLIINYRPPLTDIWGRPII